MRGNRAECIDQRVGRVIAVTPSQAIVLLESRDTAAAERLAMPLEMGTLVKLHSRVSTVYGMVTGLRVPLPSLEPSEKDLRLAELELVGEIRGADGTGFFQRGVSAYPALDEPVYLASGADLAKVYERPNAATAQVGMIHAVHRRPPIPGSEADEIIYRRSVGRLSWLASGVTFH